ncbi:putative DNA-binding transcriptional regulator YafY [Clostridium sardiniense]|nr:putative DNA-binding transcriptional regulator YafY [Clostridium sardiniense]
MKINRLTEIIIIILLNKRIVTAKELADKFQI